MRVPRARARRCARCGDAALVSAVTRAIAAVLLAASIASAQARTVQLIVPECEGLDRAVIARQLEVELSGDGIDGVVDTEGVVARIELVAEPCEDPTEVRVIVDDRATHKHLERTIDLSAVDPSVQARSIAIASAELLRASLL